MVQSARGIIDAVILEFDDVTPLDRWIEALGTLLAPDAGAVRVTLDPAAFTTLIRALLLRDAGSPRLADWLDRAAKVVNASASGDMAEDSPRLSWALVSAAASLARGDVAAADATLEIVRTGATAMPANGRLALAVVDSLHHLIGGHSGDALRIAQSGLDLATAEGLHACDGWLRVIAMVASLYGGDRAGARSLLQEFEADSPRHRRGDRACIHYVRGWLAALDDDAVTAHREAKMALAVAVETGIPWFECLARVALADLQAGSGDSRGAQTQLRGAESIAQRLASPWLDFNVKVLATELARAAQDKEATLENLRTAFRLGREFGFLQTPRWRPAAFADLCVAALEADIEPEFARALVRVGKLAPRDSAAARGALAMAVPDPDVRRIPALARRRAGRVLRQGTGPADGTAQGAGGPRPAQRPSRTARRRAVAARGGRLRAQVVHGDAPPVATDARRRRGASSCATGGFRSTGRWSGSTPGRWSRCSTTSTRRSVRRVGGATDGVLRSSPSRRSRCTADRSCRTNRSSPPTSRAANRSVPACSASSRIFAGAGRPRVRRRGAADGYLRCIDADELCEPLYRQLMLCFQRARHAGRSDRDLRAVAGRAVDADEDDALAGNAGVVREPPRGRRARARRNDLRRTGAVYRTKFALAP